MTAKNKDNYFSLNEKVEVHPFEGAYLFHKFLREQGIKAKPVSLNVNTIFGPMDQEPTTMNLEIAPDKISSFLWGSLQIDNIDGNLETSYTFTDEKFAIFRIAGTLNQIHRLWVEDLAKKFREYVKVNSLYKGKAIRLRVKDDGTLSAISTPTFIDTGKIKDNEFILDTDIIEQIDFTLFTPIKETQKCRDLNISLKRGILLEGPYGTGKTLAARATAKLCVDNGWTFILVDNSKAFTQAFELAHKYAPAVIFAEDMDAGAKGQERTDSVNNLLNTIDGIKAKNAEVIMVMTTNHAGSINTAMLRPGRIDSVVSFRTPSSQVICKLIHHYSSGLLAKTEDLSEVSEYLMGCTPAVIREVVERSKLKGISEKTNYITALDLLSIAKSMSKHISLIAGEGVEENDTDTAFAKSFKDFLTKSLVTKSSGLPAWVRD